MRETFMVPNSVDQLIDGIYEASGAPDLWPCVLDNVGGFVGASKGGLLFTSCAKGRRWIGSEAMAQIMTDFLAEGWALKNDRIPRLLAFRHPGFVRDSDLYSAEEMSSMPMYSDFLRPRGVFTSTATVISGVADDRLVLSIEGFPTYTAADQSLSSLDRLRPHLARASLLSSQLHLERARAAVAALEMVGAPAAMLGRRGNLVVTNTLFSDRLAGFGSDQPSRFRLHDRVADQQLTNVMSGQNGSGGTSIPVRRGGDGGKPVILHVILVKGEARDVFVSGSAILVAVSFWKRPLPDEKVVEALFDLTPAEVRLVRSLLNGYTLAQSAAKSGLSKFTVRNQLKSVFVKTGVRRQVDLIKTFSAFG